MADAEAARALDRELRRLPRRCESRHRPGPRWFLGEDRTLRCEHLAGHRGWHRFGGFEWDKEHAETAAAGVDPDGTR